MLLFKATALLFILGSITGTFARSRHHKSRDGHEGGEGGSGGSGHNNHEEGQHDLDCHYGYIPVHHKCVKLSAIKANFEDADYNCKNDHGKLYRPDTKPSDDVELYSYLRKIIDEPFFIGVRYNAESKKWVYHDDCTAVRYKHWHEMQSIKNLLLAGGDEEGEYGGYYAMRDSHGNDDHDGHGDHGEGHDMHNHGYECVSALNGWFDESCDNVAYYMCEWSDEYLGESHDEPVADCNKDEHGEKPEDDDDYGAFIPEGKK